jgi:hypothetical protein
MRAWLHGLLTGLVLTACTAAWGHSTFLYEFKAVRNSADFFVDAFSDGLEPPSSPNFGGCGTSCYSVAGSFPDGSEAGNRLRLDSANGIPSANANGVAVLSQRATLTLSTNDATPTAGLRAGHVYEVSALFDFAPPPSPGDTYSLALTDRASGHTLNDFAQIQVANSAGSTVIRFREQDFGPGGGITLIDSDPVSAANGDQVRLILSHPTVDTNTVFGKYEFFKAGVSQGIVSMSGSIEIYNGENWTRPEFLISQLAPVPEPAAYLMMAVGLVFVLGMTSARGRVRSGAAV